MRRILPLLLVLAAAGTVHAGWFNDLGRHLGLGWSDGYHAGGKTAPRRSSSFAIPPGGLAFPHEVIVHPAGPTPAVPPESLPTPQPSQPLFDLPQ